MVLLGLVDVALDGSASCEFMADHCSGFYIRVAALTRCRGGS